MALACGWKRQRISEAPLTPQSLPPLRLPYEQEMQTHLLHGVLHSNGFGHLLRICGREAGSGRLAGKQLMALWEHLCLSLKAKQVSVEDASKKHGMDFKILHACAFGATWYGSYGYAFGRGPFGYTRAEHSNAVAALGRFALDKVKADFAALPRDEGLAVCRMVEKYQQKGEAKGEKVQTLGCASVCLLREMLLFCSSSPAACLQDGGDGISGRRVLSE